MAERGIEFTRRMGLRTEECSARITLAKALRRQEDTGAATAIRAALARARDLVRETEAHVYEPMILEEEAHRRRLLRGRRGRLRLVGGPLAAARMDLSPATDSLEKLKTPTKAPRREISERDTHLTQHFRVLRVQLRRGPEFRLGFRVAALVQ